MLKLYNNKLAGRLRLMQVIKELKNMTSDKAYNTHLVRLWLDNNYDNYRACGDIKVQEYKTDAELIKWLKQRYYGGDADKITLDKNSLNLDSIRATIKDNMLDINA